MISPLPILSEKASVCLNTCLLLARLPPGQRLSARALDALLQVRSCPTVQRMLEPLVVAGVVEAIGGPRGGYRLARPAEQLTVGEVLRLANGPNGHAGSCPLRPGGCTEPPCVLHPQWMAATAGYRELLEGWTIAEMARSG
jgi:Rrf2 family protein